METPVAIIIFNRPGLTARLISALAQVRPRSLYVIADGPRPDRPGEIDLCREARQALDAIDWDCQVHKCFSETNLGCKRRPETGLDWLFSLVDEAIILEDDCLPHPSFFPFCEELLGRYRFDHRVMMIGGFNFFGRLPEPRQSYYFSTLASTWGWATWRRAWQLNDPFMDKWPLVAESRLIEQLFPDPVHTAFWYDVFAKIRDGRLPDAWDYQWQLSCWFNSGYRILPAVNLIANIGFGTDATHTFGENPYENLAGEIDFPLHHPELLIRSAELDAAIAENFCALEGYRHPPPESPPLLARARRRLSGLARRLVPGLRGIRR